MIEKAGVLAKSVAHPLIVADTKCFSARYGGVQNLGGKVLCSLMLEGSTVYGYTDSLGYLNNVRSLGMMSETQDVEYELPSAEQIENTTQLLQNAVMRNNRIATIGFDPEIFMHDGTGKLLPATDFLPNKKAGISASGQGGMNGNTNFAGHVYADGFAAELTTQGHSCLGWQADAVRAGLKQIREEARKKFPSADFLPVTLVEVDPEVMDSMSEEHAALGCMPSFNAYGLHGELPGTGKLLLRRVTGGHVHNGLKTGTPAINDAVAMARACDAIVGVATVSLFEGIEHPSRRKYYGLPGEFRLPKHGFEYRTLSNAWMFHPMLMHVVVDLQRAAVRTATSGIINYFNATPEEVLETVQWCNVKHARLIMERNKGFFVKLMASYYGAQGIALAAFNLFLNGAASKIADPLAVAKNWRLDDYWDPHTHNSRLCWGNLWSKQGIL